MITWPGRGPLLALCCALGFVALLGAGEARAQQTERLLILPLEHELGDDAARMRPVEAAFRAEADALHRFHVLPAAATATLLDSVRSLGLDCAPGDLECLTKAGVVMEIDLLAVVRAAAAGDRLVVSAVLIDVESGRTRASVSRTLSSGDSLRGIMRSATVELLAPDLYVGALEVSGPQPGSIIRVDGAVRGTAPLNASVGGLAPGEHVVRIEQQGFVPVERVVLVKPLESTSLVVTLEAIAAPTAEPEVAAEVAAVPPGAAGPQVRPFPIVPAVFGGVALVGVVAAAGTGVGAVLLNERLKDTTLPVDERRGARAPGQMLVVAGGTAAVIAILAAAAAGTTFFLAP